MFLLPSTLLAVLASLAVTLPVGTPPAEATSDLQSLATGAADIELPAFKSSKVEEEVLTDRYLFNLTLDSFNTLRDQRYPAFLFWESDGCSESPDHPFGFDYLPACYRHDFGYDQYRRQGRFTLENKAKVDLNFKEDLDTICSAPGLEVDICQQCREDPDRTDIDCKHRADICKFPAQDVCGCLAELYYRAVIIFGGQGTIQPGPNEKRDPSPKLIDIKVPKFDLGSLNLCLADHLPSAHNKTVAQGE